MTKSLLITPKGLVVDGQKLIPLQYSIEMIPSGARPYITAMCSSPKDHFPQDLFPCSIAPLSGSRHFRGTFSPGLNLGDLPPCGSVCIQYLYAKKRRRFPLGTPAALYTVNFRRTHGKSGRE